MGPISIEKYMVLCHQLFAEISQPVARNQSRNSIRTRGLIALLAGLLCCIPVLSGCGGQVTTASNTGTIVASPNALAFGSVAVGQASSTMVSLENQGKAPIEVSQIALTGQSFSVVGSNSFPVSIAAGQTYALNVQFSPAASGSTTGQLVITTNAMSSVQTVVNLTGQGTAASAPLAPALSALSCTGGSITGSGSAACTVTLNASAPSGGFVVNLSSSSASVAVPATLAVPANATSAQFTATVSPVASAQGVTLTASAGGAARSFVLQLNAATPTLSLSATSVAFGATALNTPATQSVMLGSTGTVPVTVNAATLTGAGFTMSGVTFPAVLSPGATAKLELQFDPAVQGAATGQLSLASNSSTGATTAVSLSGTATAPPSFANVSIGTTPGNAIPGTFMGLSHEWDTAQAMMGDLSTGTDYVYRQLLVNLTAYGSGPIQVRIGGNSTDQTGEPTPTTAQPFAELANALGVHFDLGVNLGSDNVNLAVDQTNAYVSQMPAGSLDAIEIGNEPDEYYYNGLRSPTYSYSQYLGEFNSWKTSLTPLLPSGTKLMGPAWAQIKTLQTNYPSYDSTEASALAAFSQHFYAGNGEANNPPDFLLTASAATTGPSAVAAAVAATHRLGVPFRMGEINSLYNGGEDGISNAFESALWAIDTMFEYANVGVDGVNWHGGGGAVYSCFNIKSKLVGSVNKFTLASVNPLYYGLLLFQAATGNGAHLLPVTLNTQANLTAWATTDASGTPRLALINKDENATGTIDITLSGYSHAQIYRLSAPSYLSTSGVTFAGQTFDGSTDGTIQGTQTTESVDASSGAFQISMPVTSAALVVFTK